MSLACILDVSGPVLTDEERYLFAATDPWAFILFGRSCETPAQLRKLCSDLRACVGRDCLIFIDQEGGRVQRLEPPIWSQFPPLSFYGQLYQRNREIAREACYLHHRLMGHEMHDSGINADCAPCLDVTIEGGHRVIGDRSVSSDPMAVAFLGRAAIEGLRDAGIVSVIKHIPGHGRAEADSHVYLPVVDAGTQALAQDFSVFKALADAPMAMTAHIIFEAIDAQFPASLSPTLVSEVIRSQIGFDGLLMTDDIAMKALSATRSQAENAHLAFMAGVDIALFSHGTIQERLDFVAACPTLSGKSLARAQAAESFARDSVLPFDSEAAWSRYYELTGLSKPIVYSLTPDPTAQAWA